MGFAVFPEFLSSTCFGVWGRSVVNLNSTAWNGAMAHSSAMVSIGLESRPDQIVKYNFDTSELPNVNVPTMRAKKIHQ